MDLLDSVLRNHGHFEISDTDGTKPRVYFRETRQPRFLTHKGALPIKKMLFKLSLACLVGLPLNAAYGQIVEGTISLGFDSALVFGSQPVPSPSISVPFNVKYDTTKADLVLRTTFCALCQTCYCCYWGMGSARPFHYSKLPFDSTDFSKPLDLADTSRFVKVDSTRPTGTPGETMLPNLTRLGPEIERIRKAGGFFVFRNRAEKFILARIDEIRLNMYNPAIPTVSCESGVKLIWQLQQNGQPVFARTSDVQVNRGRIGKQSNHFREYLLNGRRFAKRPQLPRFGESGNGAR